MLKINSQLNKSHVSDHEYAAADDRIAAAIRPAGARVPAFPAVTGLSLQSLVRRVDLFTLRLFLTAIEEGQIGRAAVREHIVPSAATRRIQELEDLAGTLLLERSPRGVVPSLAGSLVARHAQAMLSALEAMQRDLLAVADGTACRLSIAAPRLVIVHFLAQAIGEFTRRFPGVEVDLREELNSDALQALLAGEVTLAVYSRSPETEIDGIESCECSTDRLVAVVPLAHPLARSTAVSLPALLDHDLIGIGSRTTVMSNLRHAAAQIGLEPRVKYNVSSVEAACSLVNAGLGVALQPACMPEPPGHDGLTTVVAEGEWAARSYRVAWLAGSPIMPAALALIEQLTGRPPGKETSPAKGGVPTPQAHD